jgi:hypothetical protein
MVKRISPALCSADIWLTAEKLCPREQYSSNKLSGPSDSRGHCQKIGANGRWKYTECKVDCSKHMGQQA